MIIQKLNLKNFKPFEQQSLEFNSLTLLSGLNSTGKSSILQALLLLRQSYQQRLLPNIGLALNGDLVSVGTAKDALFEGAKKDFISVDLIWNNNEKCTWIFNYDSEADVLSLDTASSLELYQSNLFNDNFHYLQAERISPRLYFDVSDFQVRQHKQLGTRGEYTAHFLSIWC